jgi:hypothetical protein
VEKGGRNGAGTDDALELAVVLELAMALEELTFSIHELL